ncbi:MAG TPA: pyrimidine dimer DNA glycosylase/endonuclease V [Gemmatimonadaceae bacterium]|nr:pyrimidine dimer DNA glycosylase/endonuclease V [Gemmatimonadaceae bacterium]
MRLWSLHPKHLDARGLVALWREALLAKAVLQGKTKGYRHHPQLERFQAHPRPVAAINGYLAHVWHEANQRGYHFDKSKFRTSGPGLERIMVARGQVAYEWQHLRAKVRRRDPAWYKTIRGVKEPALHALFRAVPGAIASWERPTAPTD